MAGVSLAQNHWEPITGTQYNMTMNGVILIDGEEQMGTNFEVGAFCGDECRGSMRPEFFPPTNQYLVTLTVVSNQLSGEEIVFLLYDHDTGMELDLESVNNTVFENNAMIGTIGSWYEFSFETPSQTYILGISGYDGTDGGYRLITSPMRTVTPTADNGFLTPDYDLYWFDQGEELEWRNYKMEPFDLVSCKGYLYASKDTTTLEFTGQPYEGDGEIEVDYVDGAEFAGWNLIGNPYMSDAYFANAPANGTALPYARLNSDGDGYETVLSNRVVPIAPMEGFFCQVGSSGSVYVVKAPPAPASRLNITLTQNGKRRNSPVDNAIVRFDQGAVMEKLYFQEGGSKVYVPGEGREYAVAAAQSEGETSLCFKAGSDGTYTLSFEAEDMSFAYLRLIDDKTGEETDLLSNPSYSFEARTTDVANRFRLVFGANSVNDQEEVAAFAHVSGDEIVVNGEGMLQVSDIHGRLLLSREVYSVFRIPHSAFSAAGGVYVLRLSNGTDQKTQKIVLN